MACGVRGASTQEAIRSTARIIAEHGSNKLLVEETKGGLFGQMLAAHLATIGHPLSFEAVTTGGQTKGRRIIESLSPAIASGKLSICESVLRGEDGPEFAAQFTGIRYDGRKLKNDDIVDALSYAVGDVAPALAADAAEFAAGARFNIDELARMPLRRCVLTEEELETWVEESEDEEALRLKLEAALELQREETALGVENPALKRRVDQLTDDLAKITNAKRRVFAPRRHDPDFETEFYT